jgi:hypothetical protein
MNAAGIKTGDIVKCDVRRGEFLALVKKEKHFHPTLEREVIEVDSLPGRGYPRVPTNYVTSREITDHWRHPRRRKGTPTK